MRPVSTLELLDNGPFTRIARTISRQWGVNVRLDGLSARTDGTTIYIPANADDLKGADARILHGYLDHEVAHVTQEVRAKERQVKGEKCKSPLQLMKECKTNAEKLMLNVFEDVRIERIASAEYPGIAENLRLLNGHSVDLFRKEVAAGKSQVAQDPWQALAGGIIAAAMGLPMDWVEPEVTDLLTLLEDEIRAATKAQLPEDAWELAQRVIAKLKNFLKQDALPKPTDGKKKVKRSKGGTGGEGEPMDLDDVEFEEDEDGEEGQAGAAEGEEGTGKGKGGAGEDGEDGDGEGDGSQGTFAGDKDGKKGRGKGKRSEKGHKPKVGGASPRMTLAEMIEQMKQDAKLTDLNARVSDKLRTVAKDDAVKHHRYVTNPEITKHDAIVKPPSDPNAYRDCRDRVNSQINGLKSRLISVLRVRAQTRMTGDHERGTLDSAALYRVRFAEKRVFSQRTKEDTLSLAVSILVDVSGSMGHGGSVGSKAYYARHMVIALAETFAALNIPFEVMGFTNHGGGFGSVIDGVPCGRTSAFAYQQFKGFDENFQATKTRLAAITGLSENSDGEAVLFAARRLAARKQERKMLLVVSDGLPTGGPVELASSFLVEAVKRVAAAGIEIYGIGASSDAVRRFYNPANGSRYIVINDISTMATEVYQLVKGALTDPGKKAVA